jgi:hypothetical protein
MLRNTFCHISGVGLKTEAALWSKGLYCWEDVLNGSALEAAPRFRQRHRRDLESSARRLADRDAEYFASRLPAAELWRLFGTFSSETAYVDIETTGLGKGLDHITSIALSDGERVRTYVHGINLEAFADDILNYKLLVTFNGRCFDVPFLERQLAIRLPKAHIDLRFLLKGLGYRGGLKSVEGQFGLDRGGLQNVDGYFAVLLWSAFEQTGDRRYLDTLLAYNAEDVLHLETLMVEAFNRKLEQTPFGGQSLEHPSPSRNPYEADLEAIEAIKATLARRHPDRF